MAVEEAGELRLGDLLKTLKHDDAILLTEEDEERYVLGAVDDLDAEARALSADPELMAYLDTCRARGRREGSTSLEDARRELLPEP